jgi:hypothetical protein
MAERQLVTQDFLAGLPFRWKCSACSKLFEASIGAALTHDRVPSYIYEEFRKYAVTEGLAKKWLLR